MQENTGVKYYKVCQAGPDHLQNMIPCQDACAAEQSEIWTVAAVADGLGSMSMSDVGSRIAAETAVSFCRNHLKADMSDEELKKLLNNAFVSAYKTILEEAEKADCYDREYDTTLCLALYDGDTLYYAQSGDSGMIALSDDGRYVRVTRQQRDEEGRVYPLCFGPAYWQFGKTENVAAVMLMTDGVLEQICHPLMKEEEIPLNVPLAALFMEQHGRCRTAEEVEVLEEQAYAFLENYDENKLNDDKTVLVLWNDAKMPERCEESYYKVPDWDTLREKQMAALYEPKQQTDCAAASEKEEHNERKKSSPETEDILLKQSRKQKRASRAGKAGNSKKKARKSSKKKSCG